MGGMYKSLDKNGIQELLNIIGEKHMTADYVIKEYA